MVVALAVPVAIVVVAVALVGISHKHGGHHSVTGAAGGGRACSQRRELPDPGPNRASRSTDAIGPAGLIRAASGRVSGIAWQLR